MALTPSAEQDIRGIRIYSLSRWGERQANACHAALTSAFASLGDNPQLDVARDDIVPGLRVHMVERHILYYRIQRDVVEISRLFHVNLDAAGAFRHEPLP